VNPAVILYQMSALATPILHTLLLHCPVHPFPRSATSLLHIVILTSVHPYPYFSTSLVQLYSSTLLLLIPLRSSHFYISTYSVPLLYTFCHLLLHTCFSAALNAPFHYPSSSLLPSNTSTPPSFLCTTSPNKSLQRLLFLCFHPF
jgi:hypothetical protein